MNKKILLGIGSILILVLIVYFTSLNKSAPLVDETNNIPYVPQPEQIGTEMPTTEIETVGQPAYLTDAYSKDGKDYIDADYVEWFHGDAGIQAQVEDKECPNTNECWIYPNGYKRNRNPKIRTFEVSPSTSIEISGDFASELIGTTAPQKTLIISFQQFKDIALKRKVFVEKNNEANIAFIIIDAENNQLNRIIQPYQE